MGQVINMVDASFRRPADLPCTCTDADLMEAVRGWMLNAPSDQVAHLLGIRPAQLPSWINSHGWQQIVLLLRDDIRAISYGAYGRLGLKAYQALEDRLDNGDPIVDSEGTVIAHRPIKGKDLAEIMTRLGSMQDLMEKKLGLTKDDDDSISLKELASSLKRFAQAKEIRIDQTAISGSATDSDQPPARTIAQ